MESHRTKQWTGTVTKELLNARGCFTYSPYTTAGPVGIGSTRTLCTLICTRLLVYEGRYLLVRARLQSGPYSCCWLDSSWLESYRT